VDRRRESWQTELYYENAVWQEHRLIRTAFYKNTVRIVRCSYV
jgi:hypothetical protein